MNHLNFLKNRFFWLLLIVAVSVRFANLDQALFFTYDQGRDIMAIERITQGDFTLLGPVTGLEGFFTGPLWYYAAVPGFILSDGNPYGVASWYIFLTLLAVPLYWQLGLTLFPKQKKLAMLLAFFLAICPGSVYGSMKIWNPLLLIPLVSAALLALFKARESRFFLAISFFLLGLAMHAEFANAVFFVAGLLLFLPWIRQKFSIKDYLVSLGALAITGIPQLLFELRNDFIMTKALFGALLGENSNNLGWGQHLLQRPLQLFESTNRLLLGVLYDAGWLQLILWILLISGFAFLFTKEFKKYKDETKFAWKLTALMGVVSYPMYMLWRGNNGFFWDHYLTPHFMFLIPIAMLGGVHLVNRFGNFFSKWFNFFEFKFILIGVAVVYFGVSLISINNYSLNPVNDAGLKAMDDSVMRIYDWMEQDGQDPGLVRIYTANVYTEHYDYLFRWRARQLGREVPRTVKNEDSDWWYVLVEPDWEIKARQDEWHEKETAGAELVRAEKVGELELETWRNSE